MRDLLVFVLFMLTPPCLCAAIYEQTDSMEVVQYLQLSTDTLKPSSLPLFYASLLEGRPYVGGRLEISEDEQLIVDLQRLDCTTLVENALALSLTRLSPSHTWESFLSFLEKIRYYKGARNGYSSRNHYFSQWIESNVSQAYIREVHNPALWLGTQRLQTDYMSTHPALYPHLREKPALIDPIQQMERRLTGQVVHYLPALSIRNGISLNGVVQDGDIIALVTSKRGLDVSHVGIAYWETDGKLHLLHASSSRKKVIRDPRPLSDYLRQNPSCIGIRVLRICTPAKR